MKAGERLFLTVAAGSPEIVPDARMPRITVTTGAGVVGEIVIPVVEGVLAFGEEGVGEWGSRVPGLGGGGV